MTESLVGEHSVPEQYGQLLAKLSGAESELDGAEEGGRNGQLDAASGIVFDLLYSLDFKHGGEMVPRLAALYGYMANEIQVAGRTRDRAKLSHLRDMITTLQQSWYGAAKDA